MKIEVTYTINWKCLINNAITGEIWKNRCHIVRWLFNIFELVFTLCHKCNKYNCLPWKLLNHAGNSYITRRKQLCHPPDTVMSHRRQLYHPLLYLFCISIRSGSRSNNDVAKQSKKRSGILRYATRQLFRQFRADQFI